MFNWFRRLIRSKQQVGVSAPLTEKEKARQKYADRYIGQVTHYFPKIGVGIVKIEKGKLRVGDTIYVQGETTRFKQKVTSLEYNHQKVSEAAPGYEVGIKTGARVREADDVYVLES